MISCRSFLFVLLCGAIFFGCKQPYEPDADNVVTIRIASEPDKLNVLYARSSSETRIANLIFPALLDIDPNTLEIVPVIAESRPTMTEITEGEFSGGTKQEYRIRKEARWDNGDPVLAEDFVFTLKNIFNPRAGLQAVRPFVDFVKQIDVDPSDQKKFTVYSDSKYMMSELALGNMPVLPRYILDPDGLMDQISLESIISSEAMNSADSIDLIAFGQLLTSEKYNRDSSMLISCGAYTLGSWETGASVTLKRKTNWWGNDFQHLNAVIESDPSKIVYQLVKDEAGAITMLKDGQLDAMTSINPATFKSLEENALAKDVLDLYNPPFLQYYFLGLNMNNPKLVDRGVRKALAHLIDYEAIIDNVLFGMGQRIVGPLHPSNYGYASDIPLPDYNPEKAISILKDAGWEDTNNNGTVDKVIEGKRTELSIDLLASPSENSKNICLLVQSSAASGGVKINPVFKELRTIVGEHLVPRNFEMYALAWSQQVGDYDPKQLWHSESDTPSGRNWSGFNLPECDAV
ncbi:MAG: hypothetical protein KJP00_05145, partial [Bacteroidia bacterium]|nr:hypothetical protein [Bacteroidia bacterium]